MNKYVELILTCEDLAEAEKIAQALLGKHLVACVKHESVQSTFWWQGKIEEGEEVKVSMLSIAENFDRIEAEVKKLHSYETFVLQAFPITRINEDAAKWLDDNVRP